MANKIPVKKRLEAITFDYEKIKKIIFKGGYSDKELADLLNIDERTLRRWKQDYEFSQILGESKEKALDMVEMSVFKKAIGFEYTEDKFAIVPVSKDKQKNIYEEKLILTERVIKTAAPDTVAAIWILANRRPEKWSRNGSQANNEDNGKTPAVFVMPSFTQNNITNNTQNNVKMVISKEAQKEIKRLSEIVSKSDPQKEVQKPMKKLEKLKISFKKNK